MKILLDENVPEAFGHILREYETHHVVRLGWAGTKNGKLLKRAEELGYNALITQDKGFEYQQNMSERTISIIIVRPKSQGLAALTTLSSRLIITLSRIQPGSVYLLSDDE
ncbi:MAG: DUF5615 family PIN-like protein [Fimbriimonadaceae bacterium]